jgi:hypothetical protein
MVIWGVTEAEYKASLLDEIAARLVVETEFSRKGLLMVAAVDKGYISLTLFSDRGRHVEYRHVQYSRYEKLLLELWGLESLAQRWDEVEFFLKGDKFQVKFVYQEDFDPDELDTERRYATAMEYFGGKPIKYPNWDDRGSWTM